MNTPTDLPPAENTEPNAAEPPRGAPPRRRLLLKAVLVTLCLGGGLAASLAAQLPPRDAAPRSPKYFEPEHEEPPPDPTPARIDMFIRAGCYEQAMKLLRAADPKHRPSAYRTALCLEGLGRLREAAEAYHRAEDPDGDTAALARALFGRARCAAAEGNLAEARELLDRVAVRSGHPDCRGRHILEECLCLRARLELLGLGVRHEPDPLNPEALAWAPLDPGADQYAEWLPTEIPPESPARPEVGSGRIEFRRDPKKAEPTLTAHLAAKPVAAHLETIARAAHLHVHAEAGVAKRLAEHVTALDVEDAPLGEVLAALLGPCGAAAHLGGEELGVTPLSHGGHGHGAGDHVAAAVRRAIAGMPEDRSVAGLRVALANLDMGAGRSRQAAAAYRELLDKEWRAPEALHAAYNLGLHELRQGNTASAREHVMEVLDRAPGTAWADLAWWWVGRSHLDGGNAAAARAPLERALAARTKAVASAAALGLCLCDLFAGDDSAARAVLEHHRIEPSEQHAAVAEMFEWLLRHRASPSEGRKELFLHAAHEADEGRKLGPAAVYLVGLAYREMGRPDRMVALYDAAAETTHGPIASWMTFDAADRFYKLDARYEARQRYLAVTVSDPEGLGPTAELRVAELAARDGRGEECIRRCLRAAGRPGVDGSKLLAVLGRGYELQRDYRRAAECFAGRLPKE
jgi:tetratricopeptide (TPR) repeat protein